LLVCGGLSKSKVFNQTVADVCQIQLWVPEESESSALGAVMCAAVGAQVYDDLAQAARAMGQRGEVVEPDPVLRGTYRTLYKRWLKTYRTLLRG
jgi:xylulokinase